MATYTHASVTQSKRAPIPFPDQSPVLRRATFTLTATIATSDVFQMIPVFAGERVVSIALRTSDLDSGTPAIVLDVGDGDDVDRYIDGSTIGQTGGAAYGFSVAASAAAAAALDKVYTAEDTIDVLVATGPGTGAGAGGLITLEALIVKG